MQNIQEKVKLCKDCKYFVDQYPWPSLCSNPITNHIDLTYGGVETSKCTYQRQNNPSRYTNVKKACGEDAKYFEPKFSLYKSILNFFKSTGTLSKGPL